MESDTARAAKAVQTLLEELSTASNYYRHTKKKNDIAKVRISILKALEAVGRFTREMTTPTSAAVPAPLLYLATELRALNQGYKSPLFEPVHNLRAPRQSHADEALKARAAAAMQLGMNAKLGREVSAKNVARIIERSGYPFAQNQTPWRTVANWRNKVSGAAEPSKQKADYDQYLKGMTEIWGPIPSVKDWKRAYDFTCKDLLQMAGDLRPLKILGPPPL